MTTWGRLYWTTWSLIVLITFLGPEIYALATTGAPNTLSQFVWTKLNITSNERMSSWSALDFLIFCEWMTLWIWLTWHFFFRRFI
jgi:hypothetical protein